MPQRLTDSVIRHLKPPATGLRIVWDDICRGLGIRVTANGSKSFVLHYRHHRRQRSLTIGSFPDWSASQARERAQELRREVDIGVDPLGRRQAADDAPTVAKLADHYRQVHMPRKRSAHGDEAMLRNDILPRLGAEKVIDIERRDIAKLHRDIAKRAPYVANRTLSLLSKMLTIAKAEGWIVANPCEGVERMPEETRERFLNEDEIDRLMTILDQHPCGSADAVRLLILTGARKSEALTAEWSHFDLDTGTWVKPSSHTKQRRSHRVPLSQPAMELLRRMSDDRDARIAEAKAAGHIPRNEQYLFPGTKKRGSQASLNDYWKLCQREAGLTDVRIHDLRHSYASVLASSNVSLLVIGRMLGHTQSATTQRYAHLLDQPLRDAAEIVGRKVTAARPKVVTLLGKRGDAA
jgi:integrase